MIASTEVLVNSFANANWRRCCVKSKVLSDRRSATRTHLRVSQGFWSSQHLETGLTFLKLHTPNEKLDSGGALALHALDLHFVWQSEQIEVSEFHTTIPGELCGEICSQAWVQVEPPCRKKTFVSLGVRWQRWTLRCSIATFTFRDGSLTPSFRAERSSFRVKQMLSCCRQASRVFKKSLIFSRRFQGIQYAATCCLNQSRQKLQFEQRINLPGTLDRHSALRRPGAGYFDLGSKTKGSCFEFCVFCLTQERPTHSMWLYKCQNSSGCFLRSPSGPLLFTGCSVNEVLGSSDISYLDVFVVWQSSWNSAEDRLTKSGSLVHFSSTVKTHYKLIIFQEN